MKRYLHYYAFLVLLFCSSSNVFSQQIIVDGSVTLENLILDNLVHGCVEISNINSPVNGTSSGFSSFAYFEKADSNFPLQDGVMLSTGNAESGGNIPNSLTLSDGGDTWTTDPDIEAALGVTNTLNATSIEFDLVSISDQIQFNYLFASEEYFGINPCQFSDGFVILIKEVGSTSPYDNIALVPGTGDVVNTNTIHDEIYGNNGSICNAQNEQYFDGYNMGDTNFNGRTIPLTATYPITPYVQYHIKLIIADQNDSQYDSAVFLEAITFNEVDLGDDIVTCLNSWTLDATFQNPQATYQWFLDNAPIPGGTNPTLTATQSGTYRVEVTVPLNSTQCVLEDSVQVTLNEEPPIDPIPDFELCDIGSDGTELFDLQSHDPVIRSILPSGNYNLSFFSSEQDARNGIGEITTPIPNTTNPETVYVRVQNIDTGCFSYAPFNLVVNPLPIITDPTPLEVCDNDGPPDDGITFIDLTQKDSEITSGQPNLMVSYYLYQADANSGNNPLPIPYSSSSNSETLYVRVIDSQTGCVSTTTLDVNITDSPVVNTDTRYLDACDPDHDGYYESFNLNDAVSDILVMPGINITFHTNPTDAESGSNPIPDPNNFQNTVQDVQILYIRVEDDSTHCATVVPLEVHSNLLLTGTNIEDFALCDDASNDGIADFPLNAIAASIINGLPFNLSVTFYEDIADRDNNNTANALDSSVPYTATSPQTLYITITNEDTGCSEQAEIKLLVNPILQFQSVDPIEYCDTDEDGIANVDLHSLDDIIKSGNPNFEVHYFLTQQEAEDNNPNYEISFYDVTNTQIFYARIENIGTSCHTVNEFEITIHPAPAVNDPLPFIICDNDQDGYSVVNLEDKIPEIVTDPIGLNFSFYTSLNDAQSGTNQISNPTTYNANTQDVFVRVENSDGCPNYVTIEIVVSTLPVFPTISNYEICESDGDEKAEFLLSEKDAEILNGQAGKDVFYFEDPNYTNLIPKNTPYTNISSPQTIYVRVQNTANTSCYGDASFTIEVSRNPIYNSNFNDYLICDDSSNDGIEVVDLSEKITEISQGAIEDLNISFHRYIQDAENNENALPLQYTNEANPQTLYVRIQEVNSSCYLIEELGINIIAAPNVTQASPMQVCDTDHDGFTTFNLEDADYELLERVPSNFVTNYFENETDVEDLSRQINNPSAYTNKTNPQTVYIKITNSLTGCYSVIPQELIVDIPPITFSIGTVEICDNDTNTYDLSQLNTHVTNAQSNSDISYHTTLTDAENNANPIPNNIFEYTGSSGLYTFYVRIVNRDTGCPIIAPPFDLQIDPKPVANTPPDLEDCDDDYDGFLVFDLSQQDSVILGNEDPNDYTITYHPSLDDAESKVTTLNNLHSSYSGEIIYARMENNATGCYDIISFSTIVYPLPVININDEVPLCNDTPVIISADTGNPDDTYLWSTGEITTEIMVYPEDLGDYWVTVTTPNNCEATKAFSVIESEEATINFTTTVDFADPNSITVDISGVGDYVYILDDGEPQTSNVFENVTFGLHTVTVRDLNGCQDVSKEVIVIDVPKFVTPNNDGYFDTWHIVGIEEIPGTIVYIYDRHGKLLKTLPSTSVGWDGTFNGQNMPSDDYWFVAKVKKDGNEFDVKGHFALKR